MKTSQHVPRPGAPLVGQPLSSRHPTAERRSCRSAARWLGGTVLLALASGCPSPDAEGKYDRFNEQTEDDRDRPEPKLDLPPVGTGTGGQVFPDITGVYLLAIETSIAPGLYLQFIADVTAELDEATGDGTISVEFQPLSLEQGSNTEPREEVGDSISIDAPVTGGSFTLDFGTTMVTGEANPITGAEITATLSLEATIRTEDGWCGLVLGTVQSPIMAPLDGSTFGAMRLADRSERPLEFPVKCGDIDVGGGGETDGETEADTDGMTTTGM